MPSEEDVDLGLCGPGLFSVLACRRVRPPPQRMGGPLWLPSVRCVQVGVGV